MTSFDELPEHPLASEVRSVAETLHLGERYRELDRAPAFPAAEFRRLGEAGLLGLTVPRRLGGREMPPSRAAAVLFDLARWGGTAFAKLALQPEFSSVLGEHGSPELVDQWYRPLVRGEVLVGNQVTEPNAGSDVGSLALTAERTPLGYRLTGTKSEAAFAVDAAAAIVYARTPPNDTSRGLTAFLVPQTHPGVVRDVYPPDLGEHWQRRGTVKYNAVEVAGTLRIGEEGAALEYLRGELERERGLLAAIYLGVARASWEEVVHHAGERTVAGRRLAERQAVAFPLVDDAVDLEACWLFTVRALERLERGEDAAAETAMAKVRATEVALRTIDHAIQFHGGPGYSGRLVHEQRWRDVRSGPIAHGASEVLRGLAARRLWPPPARR